MLYKVFILFSLISGYSVFADTGFDQTQFIQHWKLKEVISNPSDTTVPFPESIKIEFTNEKEGNLVMKLRSQDKTKVYPFSKSSSKHIQSVQYYNHNNPDVYSLRENAVVSFSEDTITVNLTWVSLQGKYKGKVMPGSYEFVLHDEILDFKRINDTGDDLLVFTATYFKNTHLQQ